MTEWSVEGARRLAAGYLSGLGDRWLHVRAVGAMAEDLYERGLASAEVVAAAWLHDLGYAEQIAETGLHALDGARFLRDLDAPSAVMSLVAFHTGAEFEASERGLSAELATFPQPRQSDLDLLTFVDLSIGPSGAATDPAERVKEILARYTPSHPVHRAVAMSGGVLLESAARGARSAGQPM